LLLWLVRRLIASALVIVVVSSLVFLVTHVFTDPAQVSLPFDASEEQLETRRDLLGLNRPLVDQYGEFAIGLFTADLGDSYWQKRPAWDIVVERLPETLKLVAGAMTVTVLLAIPLGLLAAWSENRFPDRAVLGFSLMSISAPPFWVGYLLLIVFAVNLGWVPVFGSGGFKSVVLPSVTIGLASAGRMAQILRRGIIDELRQPYAITAFSRGFSRLYTIVHHTFRNVATSVVTFSGWELVRMVTGYTVVIEVVYAWPGIGQLAIQAAEQNDLILLQATVVALAALVVIGNLLVDLTRLLIDPRVETT